MSEQSKPTLYDSRGNQIITEKGLSSLDRDFIRWTGTGVDISVKDVESQPYKLHALMYACCYAILRSVSRLNWYLHPVDDDTNMIFDHEVLRVLNRPNLLMTKTTFLQSIILSLLLPANGTAGKKSKGGQCFLLPYSTEIEQDTVNLDRGEVPAIIIPYNDNYIRPRVLKDNDGDFSLQSIVGWDFEIPGHSNSIKHFGMNEIIRIYQFNPYNWLEGIANSQPAMTALMTDLKSSLYNDSLLENFGIPTGILSTEKMMSPPQREQELAHWNAMMSGPGNGNRTAILSHMLKYQNIGLTNVDMQYKEMKYHIKNEIIASFGLNKSAIGDYEKLNYATLKEGRRMLWHDSYLPIIDMICEALNNSWIINVDRGRYRIGLDTSKVEVLQPDYKSKSETAGILVEKVFLSPVLALRKAGIPLSQKELEDNPWLLLNPLELKKQYNTFSSNLQPSSDNDDDDDDNDDPKKFLDKYKPDVYIKEDVREKFWYKYVAKTLDPNEKKYVIVLRKFFDSQRNLFQDQVDAWLQKQTKALILSIDDFMIDKQEQNNVILNQSKPIFQSQLLLTQEQLKEELGQLIMWNVSDDMIDMSLLRRSRFLQGLNTTVFKRVGKQIQTVLDVAIIENWTPQETAKEIKKSISKVYEIQKTHALTIARTEIGSVTEDARYNAFVMENVNYHEWVSALDEKVRETHILENSQIVQVGERFPNTGLLHPLDDSTGNAGEVINCRCVNIAVEEPK